EVRGDGARLIGLMTQSDEESLEQAEAGVRAQRAGLHRFKVIQTTVDAELATSRLTSLAAPEDFTFRQLDRALELGQREPAAGTAAADGDAARFPRRARRRDAVHVGRRRPVRLLRPTLRNAPGARPPCRRRAIGKWRV